MKLRQITIEVDCYCEKAPHSYSYNSDELPCDFTLPFMYFILITLTGWFYLHLHLLRFVLCALDFAQCFKHLNDTALRKVKLVKQLDLLIRENVWQEPKVKLKQYILEFTFGLCSAQGKTKERDKKKTFTGENLTYQSHNVAARTWSFWNQVTV